MDDGIRAPDLPPPPQTAERRANHCPCGKHPQIWAAIAANAPPGAPNAEGAIYEYIEIAGLDHNIAGIADMYKFFEKHSRPAR